MNIAIIAGNIGKDAETRFTPSGDSKTQFSVATNEKWTDKASGEKKEKTIWHNVVIWKRDKLAQYLVKGARVTVHGKIDNRSYQDKDGTTKYISEIVAEDVFLMGAAQGGGGGAQAASGDSDWNSWSNTPPAAKQQPQAQGAPAGALTDEEVPW